MSLLKVRKQRSNYANNLTLTQHDMYNFDQQITRRGTNSVKWDEINDNDLIPMWVADMDFQAAPAIQKALEERVKHGVFGYTIVPDSYYKAIINWFSRRHQWQIERSWIIYTTGVVPAISATLHALAMPGEKVLIQSPAYNCFFSSIRNQGCEVVESPLKREKDSYVMDWDDFETKCADEKTTIFLLCNPHNPSGRVWTKEELSRMNDICMRHNVIVVSDEIHCELVMPGYTFTPFAAVNKACQNNSITLNSPTKNFNIAGLQIANIICKPPIWRRRINRSVNIFEVCDVNPFGPIALEAAYNNSEDWINELNLYLYDNYIALKNFFEKEMPQVEVLKLEGTYLVWINIKALAIKSETLANKLLSEGHLLINSGTLYSEAFGEGYLRINIATPRATMIEGLQRMAKVVKAL